MNAHVLFTGFEPWADLQANPSWDALNAAEISLPSPFQLQKLRLPVSWSGAWPQLLQHITPRTHAVVAFGLASARSRVSVERFAHNLRSTDHDTDDFSPGSDLMLGGCPPAYTTRLPHRRILQSLHAAEIPCEESRDAGIFLCNYIYYRLLHHSHTCGIPHLAGFIHVPPADRLQPHQWARLFQCIANVVTEQ